MTGRILHSVAFLTDLQAVLSRRAPVLLDQPVSQALAMAWELCAEPGANDYDPGIRKALGIVADVLRIDVGPLRSVAELPISEDEAIDRIYSVGNVHSLASYLIEKTALLFSNSNVESVYIGPVGEDSALVASWLQKKLFLLIDSRYSLEGSWYEFSYVVGPERSEALFSKQDFTERGLEFFTDFARDSGHVSWIAFPQYRLAMGRREEVPPWIPLPSWR